MGCGASVRTINDTNDKAEETRLQTAMQFLSSVSLLAHLPKEELRLIAAALTPKDFEAGEVVFSQGDSGNELYIINDGLAKVSVKGQSEELTVEAGDFFGEKALLYNEERMATVTALSSLSTLVLARKDFAALRLHHKVHFAHRKTVGFVRGRKDIESLPAPAETPEKTPEEIKFIAEALNRNANLGRVISLSEHLDAMIESCWSEEVPNGLQLIKEGDAAERFYVVQSGCFGVTRKRKEDKSGAEVRMRRPSTLGQGQSTIKAGGSFGELALLFLAPRSATVTALEDSKVWVFHEKIFKSIFMKASKTKMAEFLACLERVDFLASLRQEEKMAVVEALVEVRFYKDQVIMTQGDWGRSFYILVDGEVIVEADDEPVRTLVGMPSKGETPFFGERALLERSRRTATVRVTSPVAKLLAVDRDSFNLLLRPLESTIRLAAAAKGYTKDLASILGDDTPMSQPSAPPVLVSMGELTKIGLMGYSLAAVIELYKDTKSHRTYAVKSWRKSVVAKSGLEEEILREKNLAQMVDSSFVSKFHKALCSSDQLHLVMEPAIGGNLLVLYRHKDLYGNSPHVKFHLAGVVMGLEHIQNKKIVYRNLKPENVMLSSAGHVKLTNLCLARFVLGKTYTLVGTPDYFAPEMISLGGYTSAVDWWMLGVLLFELMAGYAPFTDEDLVAICANITRGVAHLDFPIKCQGPVGELIRSLLEHQPSMRLPMLSGHIDNIRMHRWYSGGLSDYEDDGFNWNAFANLQMTPPYVPVVRSPTDLSNFDILQSDVPPDVVQENSTNWDCEHADWERDFLSA